MNTKKYFIITVMALLGVNAIAIPKHRNTDSTLKCKNMFTYKNKDFSNKVSTNGSAVIILNGNEAILKDRLDIIWSLTLAHVNEGKEDYQYIYTKNQLGFTQFATVDFNYTNNFILLLYGTNSNENGKLTTQAICELT